MAYRIRRTIFLALTFISGIVLCVISFVLNEKQLSDSAQRESVDWRVGALSAFSFMAGIAVIIFGLIVASPKLHSRVRRWIDG